MPEANLAPVYQDLCPSPLGDMRLACQEDHLIGIWFVDKQQHAPAHTTWIRHTDHPVLQRAAQQLSEYFAGERHTFELPVQPAWGTPFQQKIWQALSHVPFGHTCTYGDIAQRIGQPSAVRAVGAAIGKNPHSVVVPCHRVLGASGKLTGYAGGLERKEALLRLESALLT